MPNVIVMGERTQHLLESLNGEHRRQVIAHAIGLATGLERWANMPEMPAANALALRKEAASIRSWMRQANLMPEQIG